MITDIPINFLIDTGSTVSLISTETFNHVIRAHPNLELHQSKGSYHSQILPTVTFLDPELPHNIGNLQNVNGSDLTILGSSNIEISIGESSFFHEFIICDITPDAILGQDFLLKYVKKIDYQTHVLKTEKWGHTMLDRW